MGKSWCLVFLRHSVVVCRSSAKGKIFLKLVKILGGRQHRTTPVGQILGVATPATPAALTPMVRCMLYAPRPTTVHPRKCRTSSDSALSRRET